LQQLKMIQNKIPTIQIFLCIVGILNHIFIFI
jgi:hypothetical protein